MNTLILNVPDFSKGYVSLVEKDELNRALKKNTKRFTKLLKQIPEKKINFSYAEGKWTVKQVLQHIIDAERIFTYRALWFARKDPQPLPGFDENIWALQAPVWDRAWDDMLEEFKCVRKATEILFSSFNNEQLNASGISNNSEVSVAAFGYICAGHVAHHMNVLNERYLESYEL